MERLPWTARFRHAATARRLLIATVTALALTVLAVAGVAATLAPGPNGCPTNKSLKTAPIADLAPPARTQIEAFDVLSGPVNSQTQTFTLKVRVGSTCSGIDIKGASVYVTAVPYNQFSIPAEELTGDDGTATLVFRRDANFPASSKQQQLTLFIRATKPGEANGDLAGVSTRRLVAVNFCELAPDVDTAAPEPARGAAVARRESQTPTTISHTGTRMNPKNPSGVRSDAPITIVAHASGVGSIPLRRAPRPVARSIAANATFQPSQSYECSWFSV